MRLSPPDDNDQCRLEGLVPAGVDALIRIYMTEHSVSADKTVQRAIGVLENTMGEIMYLRPMRRQRGRVVEVLPRSRFGEQKEEDKKIPSTTAKVHLEVNLDSACAQVLHIYRMYKDCGLQAAVCHAVVLLTLAVIAEGDLNVAGDKPGTFRQIGYL